MLYKILPLPKDGRNIMSVSHLLVKMSKPTGTSSLKSEHTNGHLLTFGLSVGGEARHFECEFIEIRLSTHYYETAQKLRRGSLKRKESKRGVVPEFHTVKNWKKCPWQPTILTKLIHLFVNKCPEIHSTLFSTNVCCYDLLWKWNLPMDVAEISTTVGERRLRC